MANIGSSMLSPSASLALMQASQGQNAATGKSALDAKKLAKIEGTSKEFEGMYVSEMLKPMFEGLQTDGMFGGGKGEEVFRGLLVQEYGKLLAKSGGVGLSSSIKQQMILMQEQANAAQAKSASN